ncbi:hypothetical protein BKA62DRAFT_707746 [Auriculariales sp. MPI-PUGE-AT-0066]|nr:hypothetical protein BKA62DRAFT_707746 [Auriculariales sp. MPI-PUGE-AT-0066]
MIVRSTAAALLLLFRAVNAHGDHGHGGSGEKVDVAKEGYIRSHMVNEHHIDTFDLESFFMLHDLDRDGFWDRGEIEAVYGVHHDWNPKDKDLAKIKVKADQVVDRVLKLLDKDGDGRVSQAEFQSAGFNGLPDMRDLGAEGHHYDVESEFFLHHEELFHSTPETQTDEAYSHPEDEEHFANHEHIEAEEERRERIFQGLAPEGELPKGHNDAEAPAPSDSHATDTPATGGHGPGPGAHEAPPPPVDGAGHPHDNEDLFQSPDGQPVEQQQQQVIRERPKIVREDPPEKKNPQDRYRNVKESAEGSPEWGEGDAGYKRPKTPADKMRRNVPYKYKFRRNWGDF